MPNQRGYTSKQQTHPLSSTHHRPITGISERSETLDPGDGLGLKQGLWNQMIQTN